MFTLTMEGAVARITIDRGEKRNAVPIGSWLGLENAIREANCSDARLVVIESSDPESFCAGSDLSELDRLIDDVGLRARFRGAMASAFLRIHETNKPTVAVIRGGCFGTGVSLATACDIRVAHPDASFAITPARFGISYPQADLDRLVALVGPGQAARLVYSCEAISGNEANRIGLVEVLDSSADVGSDLIERIAGNAPSSLCTLKATLLGRSGVNERFDASFASHDFAEGMSAFQDHRTPTFAG
ncbi:enoyl-CoA hydratase/isomerase family protein [Sphingomonas oryzagri]